MALSLVLARLSRKQATPATKSRRKRLSPSGKSTTSTPMLLYPHVSDLLFSFTTIESGARDETQTLPVARKFRVRRRNRQLRRPVRTSMISTFPTTTKPTSFAVKPGLTPSSSLPTGRIPPRVAPAGSVSPSWLTSPEKAPGVVLVVPARSASANC